MKDKISNSERRKDMRILISIILRTGVLASAALLLTGGILFAFQHPDYLFSFKSFAGEPERLRDAGVIITEALQFKSRSVIQLGILILIATPVLRVIFSFVEFILHKDRVFVLITAVVITALFYSLFG